jgi:beta-glucanase (GH16 family)
MKPTLTADRYGEEFLYNGRLDLNQEGCNNNNENGCIIAAGQDIVNPIQSARMRTSQTFSFTYGSAEIRAKMPKGDWIWPAIWMLPTDEAYGGWPRSGEIDITEVRGNLNYSCNGYYHGRQLSGSTLHWGTEVATNSWQKTHWEKINIVNDFASDFHLYRVDWLPSGIEFFIDNQSIGKVTPPAGGFWELGGYQGDNIWKTGSKMAPFDKNFHFVLNVAVGGNYFPDGCVNIPFNKPWGMYEPVQMRPFWENRGQWLPTWNAGTEDNAMQVDYIRVYSA